MLSHSYKIPSDSKAAHHFFNIHFEYFMRVCDLTLSAVGQKLHPAYLESAVQRAGQDRSRF